jgi:hypothetical protein
MRLDALWFVQSIRLVKFQSKAVPVVPAFLTRERGQQLLPHTGGVGPDFEIQSLKLTSGRRKTLATFFSRIQNRSCRRYQGSA